jgi:hypothetical protein
VVVEANSFPEAARRLKMPISTVSRKIAEHARSGCTTGGSSPMPPPAQLGVRLLERSTRSLRLTELGTEVLEHAIRSAEISEAVRSIVSNRPLVMNTAVIGLGNIGSRLARNLTAGGQKVILADKTVAKAQKLAVEVGGNAEAMPVADAIGKANIIVFAVYFDAIKQLIATYTGALAGKIIVDPSNPIAPD